MHVVSTSSCSGLSNSLKMSMSCDSVTCAVRACRYGTVVVKVGEKELSTLGRGKFVGERTLVTGKLRSASCIAKTRVTAIVMQKREFLEVDNPMLDWMIPYDAARAVLKDAPEVKTLAPEQFETLLDRFQPKCEAHQGATVVAAGAVIDALVVFITGTIELVDASGQARFAASVLVIAEVRVRRAEHDKSCKTCPQWT
jgi:Cyclic nucleotide-binding domain